MPKTRRTYVSVPNRLRPKWDNPKPFKRRIRVHIDSINTKENMCDTIGYYYGEGKFNVLIHSERVPSKRYSNKFNCRKNRGCGYYLNGTCKIWKRHEKGWQCKMNRRWHPNMKRVARLNVREVKNPDGSIEYMCDWDKRYSRMTRFWFWRDGR